MGLILDVRWALVALAGLTFACDELPDIQEGVCGNKLVEPGAREVCDGFAKATSGSGRPTLCAEPGERFQCQYVHDADHDCPSGYGPGLDGLCRQALGTFSTSPAHVDATGASLAIADFDGDARNDLLTWSPLAAEAKVTYLGTDLQPRGTSLVAMSRALRAPTVGFLGSDRAADVALADPIGVLVFRGRSNLAFEPKSFTTIAMPPSALPIAVPIAALVAPERSGAVQGTQFVGTLIEVDGDLVVVSDAATDATEVARVPNAALADVLGITLVDLDAAGAFTNGSDEIVFAIGGANERVVAVTPHADPDLRLTRSFSAFAVGQHLLAGPFKVDSRIGIGVGDALSRSVMLLSTDPVDELKAEELSVGDAAADAYVPIAMGSYDIFGLKLPFVVLPYQVLLQTQLFGCTTECFTLVGSNTSLYPWSAAAVDEKNAIVVAGSYAATGLDVFRYNAGQSALNGSRISTDAPVVAVYPGNFDGDSATDFLIQTRFGQSGCDDDSRLAVSWGDAAGFPTQPVSVGDVPGLTWVAPGSYAAPPQIDAITDFVVKTDCEDTSHAGYFLGTATRQLESPFPLGLDLPELDDVAGDTTNAGATALALVDIGAREGEGPDGIDDLLALASNGETIAMVAFYGGPDGELTAGAEAFPIANLPDANARAAAIGAASVAPIDADGDGDRDVLLVLSIPEDPEALPVVFRPHVYVGIADAGTLTFSERAVASGSFDWLTRGEADKPPTTGTAFYAAELLTTDLAYADADADGVQDLVARVATPNLIGFDVPQESYLFSFKGLADGSFAEHSFGLPDADQVTGIAAVAGRVPGAALAVATVNDVLLCGAEAGEVGCVSAGIAAAETDNIGVQLADLDSDGVPDLAVARGSGIEIHRQLTAQDEVGNDP